MFQANQAHAQISSVVGAYPGWITGIIFAVIVFAVIVGGIKSIANVTEKVVPFMGVMYVLTALVILLLNADKIGWAFGQIFAGAFTGLGVAGGFVGALIQGFKRAAFSNEAGVGSAAIAHSAVRTKEPITEGLVSLLEPFIDTVVICTMTALVITISGLLIVDPATGNFVLDGGSIATVGGVSGVSLTSAAFATGFSWFPYILAIAVVLVRLLNHDHLVILRFEGLDLPVRRRQEQGTGIQDPVLRLRGHRRLGQSRSGDRLLRRCHLCHGSGQHHGAVLPDADSEKRNELVHGAPEVRRDQAVQALA